MLLLLHGVESSLEHERDCDKDTLTAILLPLETGPGSYPNDISNTSTREGEGASLSSLDIMIIICNCLLLELLLRCMNRGTELPFPLPDSVCAPPSCCAQAG